ncbi:hypothetical protein BCU93_13575 [Vibrio breoganii]|uniref:hypothetical protein n=1 Tax=Vibrio breoganii TaxID=553239 RepID=UPI000C823579|nr:hypothetical protein [Vibrio breoganii]PMG38572.1 hypothetical protein BCU93_13575 [Vibrio breoganii]
MNKLNQQNELDTLVARYNLEKPKGYAETKPYADELSYMHHNEIDPMEMVRVIEALSHHYDPRYVSVMDIYGISWAFAMVNGKLYDKYLVSDTGIVFTNTVRGGNVMAQIPNTRGYLEVQLFANCKRKKARVHRVVVESHRGTDFTHNSKSTATSLTVDHMHSCKIDNRLEHLTVMSHAENISKGRSKAVTLQCVATGELLHAESQGAMSKLIGASDAGVSSVLRNNRKTIKGYQLPVTH